MTSALGIAGVTAVLRNLLDNGFIDDQVTSAVGNVTVSALAPDLIPLDKNGTSQLNLFLYQVTPNAGWRNVGLPSRDTAGERLTNPPLALDIHYLLTAYASKDLHAEILLGYGMQLLHETSVLSRAAIRRALRVPGLVSPGDQLPPELEAEGASGLGEQVEAIKVTLAPLGTDELSKLWSAFQSRYRPSAAYVATVVLIEAERPTRSPLPVRARRFYVTPFEEPVIEQVLHQDAVGGPIESQPPILARQRLVLRGRNLKADRVRVRVGPLLAEPSTADVAPEQVVVTSLAGLSAGVHSAQVIHERLMGDPPEPHVGVSSNVIPVVLHPEIVEPVSPPFAQGFLRVSVRPPVEARQRVELLLNERLAASSPPPSRRARAYTFTAPSRPDASPPGPFADIDVPIPGVASGDYLVRIRVDGATSPLGPVSGAYASPSVSIP